jgi:hypothetical protein
MRTDAVVTTKELLEGWEQLIEQVEEGYPDNIDEYLNDLEIRGALDRRMKRGEEPRWVAERLAVLDERFRALLLPEPARADLPWWEGHLPRRAGAELANAARQWYGIEIEIV